jgi:chondroitin 4-sulfotransferase 11
MRTDQIEGSLQATAMDRMIEQLRNYYRLLPRALRMAALVRRRERLWIEQGILFIHVPKAAGTSLNQALYGRFMGHPRASDIERWGSARLRKLPRFAVVRNPWDRLLSAYRFARRGSGGGEAIAGMSNPEQYHVPEFDSFERFIREWLARRDVRALDGVFRPQYLYVCDGTGRTLVDHLGRFEDLGSTCSFIEHSIGKPIGLPRTNWSGDELDYRQMYTDETRDIVAKIYRQDAETFGYDF